MFHWFQYFSSRKNTARKLWCTAKKELCQHWFDFSKISMEYNNYRFHIWLLKKRSITRNIIPPLEIMSAMVHLFVGNKKQKSSMTMFFFPVLFLISWKWKNEKKKKNANRRVEAWNIFTVYMNSILLFLKVKYFFIWISSIIG